MHHPHRLPLAIGLMTFAAVLLWRSSVDMPQPADDGIEEFSADDRPAPAMNQLILKVHADLRPPEHPGRFARACAPVAVTTSAVNVITI